MKRLEVNLIVLCVFCSVVKRATTPTNALKDTWPSWVDSNLRGRRCTAADRCEEKKPLCFKAVETKDCDKPLDTQRLFTAEWSDLWVCLQRGAVLSLVADVSLGHSTPDDSCKCDKCSLYSEPWSILQHRFLSVCSNKCSCYRSLSFLQRVQEATKHQMLSYICFLLVTTVT